MFNPSRLNDVLTLYFFDILVFFFYTSFNALIKNEMRNVMGLNYPFDDKTEWGK